MNIITCICLSNNGLTHSDIICCERIIQGALNS